MKISIKCQTRKYTTEGLNRAVIAAALVIQADAKIKAPRDTGRLSNSIIVNYPTPTKAIIGTSVEYAAIQEYGGVIKSKTGKKLRFKTKDGVWHTVDSVYIPPQPYMRPAVIENERTIKNIMIRELLK